MQSLAAAADMASPHDDDDDDVSRINREICKVHGRDAISARRVRCVVSLFRGSLFNAILLMVKHE